MRLLGDMPCPPLLSLDISVGSGVWPVPYSSQQIGSPPLGTHVAALSVHLAFSGVDTLQQQQQPLGGGGPALDAVVAGVAASLPCLRRLSVCESRFRSGAEADEPADLSPLSRLTGLTELSLTSSCPPAGLERLGGLRRLQLLLLDRPGVPPPLLGDMPLPPGLTRLVLGQDAPLLRPMLGGLTALKDLVLRLPWAKLGACSACCPLPPCPASYPQLPLFCPPGEPGMLPWGQPPPHPLRSLSLHLLVDWDQCPPGCSRVTLQMPAKCGPLLTRLEPDRLLLRIQPRRMPPGERSLACPCPST